MAHFAKVDNNNIVQEVLVFSDEVESGGGPLMELPTDWRWIQTSYNKRIRKNFASIGMIYDETRDAFLHIKPFLDWILNEETCEWEPPTPKPERPVDGEGNMGDWIWNETTHSWDPYL
jgi:hypothetical protein